MKKQSKFCFECKYSGTTILSRKCIACLKKGKKIKFKRKKNATE